jgi:hypothetical protein
MWKSAGRDPSIYRPQFCCHLTHDHMHTDCHSTVINSRQATCIIICTLTAIQLSSNARKATYMIICTVLHSIVIKRTIIYTLTAVQIVI